ncbi:MAG: sigma 54-interacting transcriptional regulator, partial [Deltaproteobacteria bacterium]|nr:sigma 54-interacting transcriptional regulator [Deltaproteobacteria bacterium]
FLDEIGELPAAAQVRLLRVLQDGSFQRVGAQETRSVDVRIVAATHRDLHALVRDGSFRQDLWYRVSVFPLRIPPLRERPGDIPALAAHFAALAGERLHGAPLVPSPADHGLLVGYPWPGNVRELAAVVERAAILGDGKRLDVATALGGAVPVVVTGPAVASDPALVEALRACHGRIEGPFGAATRLGVNPHTLRSRLRRQGIDWTTFRGGRPAG